MGWPTISGVMSSIPTKFGGDISQTLSNLFSNIDIAVADATWKPLVNTDVRFRSGRLRFSDESVVPNEIQHTVVNQGGARTIQIPLLDAAPNVPVYASLAQTLTGKIMSGTNNSFSNIPISSLTGSFGKPNMPATTVYTDQTNTFGAFDQKFPINRLWVANSAGTFWAKLGFLGSATNNYDIMGVGADSALLAVSKTGLALGDLFYYDGTKLIRIGIGSTNQILRCVAGIPSWSNETSLSNLPSRGYFATDYASSTTLGSNRYQSIAGDSSVSTTLSQRTTLVTNDIVVKSVRATMVTNSMNATTRAGIMDDGVLVASVSISAGATGTISNTGLSVTIAAGSAIALVYDTQSAASGTYEIRPVMVEYEIGAPGAFGGTVVKEIGTQVGTNPRSLNFSIGTDFDITEDVPNNEFDIKIANDAITTAHILNANVTLAKLASNSVDASKIVDLSVGTAELAGSIPDSKLAAITDKAKLPSDVLYSASNVATLPSVKKTGWCIPATGGATIFKDNFSGLLAGQATNNTFTLGFDTTHGAYLRNTSSGAIGNYVGWENGSLLYARAHNCYMKAKFKTSRTDIRQFFGFINTGATMVGDDPLLTREGVIVGKVTTNPNWQIMSNDGTGSTVYTNTGVAVETANPHTVEIFADATNNKFRWSFDGGALADLTTNIPAATTALRIENYIDPRSANVVNYDTFYVDVKNDK